MIGVPEELTELKAQVRAINSAMTDRSACYYCADMAQCEDHVIPHSLLHGQGVRRRGYEVDTLPACNECNGLLSSTVTETLKARKAHLADRVKQRYRTHLNGQVWTQDELASMSINLLGYALEFNRVRELTERRLTHLRGLPYVPRIQAENLTPSHTLASQSLLDAVEIDSDEEFLNWNYERIRFVPRVNWRGRVCHFQAEAQPYPLKRAQRIFHRKRHDPSCTGVRMVTERMNKRIEPVRLPNKTPKKPRSNEPCVKREPYVSIACRAKLDRVKASI